MATAVVAFSLAVGAPGPCEAHAGKLLGALIELAAEHVPIDYVRRAALRSTARALTIGPALGGGAMVGQVGETAGLYTLGLGFQSFDNPSLSIASALMILRATAKKRLPALLRRHGVRPGTTMKELRRQLGKEGLKRLGKDVYAIIKPELLAMLRPRLDTWPAPSLLMVGEIGWSPGRDAWQLRGSAGFLAISRLLLGPTMTLHLGPRNSLALGLEGTLSAMPGPGVTTPLYQLYARYDAYLINRAAFGHQGVFGLRVYLDAF